MKIAKLTWLNNGNFGTVLQAYALQKILRNKGYEVIDINYKASKKTKLINWAVNMNSPKLFIEKFKEKKALDNNKEILIKRNNKIESFKRKYLIMTKEYTSPLELKKTVGEYDIYICGSDQIWSPVLMNPVFYLNFVPDKYKKIAYAPSFGVVSTSRRKEKKISKMLSEFDKISIREDEGRKFIKKITGKKVPVLLDPTLLLEKNDWEECTSEPIIKDKYIYCYFLTENKKYLETIKKFAETKKMKVVISPTIKGPFNTGFDEYTDVGPSEWLSLIKNAEYVCTDSYHGLIFSLIFNKNVFIFKRFTDESKASQNSRVYTLTRLLGIEDRILDELNLNKMSNFDKIDYLDINEKMKKCSEKSIKWLIDAIEKNEEDIDAKCK